MTASLLQTAGGIKLCPELCLRVAEQLIATDPKGIESLLLTSKSIYTLLKAYEKSICASVSESDHRLVRVNVSQHKVLLSRMPLGSYAVTAYTYAWVAEMRCRVETVEFLINHELTGMIDHHAQSWPTLQIGKQELYQRLALFKRHSFCLLYRLADCTTGLTKTLKIRVQQSIFLDSLTSAELASLGVIVEVIGQNYFTLTKKTLDLSHSGSLWNPRLPSQEWFFDPSSGDLVNDNWIRESMCVFEDLIQRFGPHFPYAFLEGGKDKPLRPDRWAQKMLQEGLDNMNAFELGYTMSFASLQSVVWKVFCRKVVCTLQDSWIVAKEIVEKEMRSYEIVGDE